MSKKLFDLKLLFPELISMDHFGNEENRLIITDLDKHDDIYELLKDRRPVSIAEFNKAVTVVLTKFVQDKLKHVVVDLDIFTEGIKNQQPSDIDNVVEEHGIMKKFIADNGLWEKFINTEEFVEYLRKDYNGN